MREMNALNTGGDGGVVSLNGTFILELLRDLIKGYGSVSAGSLSRFMEGCDLITPLIKSRDRKKMGQFECQAFEAGYVRQLEDIYFSLEVNLRSEAEPLLELITMLLMSSVQVTELMHEKERFLRFVEALDQSRHPTTTCSVS